MIGRVGKCEQGVHDGWRECIAPVPVHPDASPRVYWRGGIGRAGHDTHEYRNHDSVSHTPTYAQPARSIQ